MTGSYRTLALFLFAGAFAVSGATPNFSGHWKLNAKESKLDGMEMQEDRTIDHKDPELTVSLKGVVDGDEEESTSKYRTDGKETRNLIDGDPEFTKAHWDGDALAFDGQIISDTDTTEMHDRWTVSEDGKRLTMERKVKVGFDERQLVFVFDRVAN
jgi:hypothetical protein